MSEEKKKLQPGSIGWMDLTVPEAGKVKDFYREVVGWKASPLDMGGYDDYVMSTPGKDEPVSGVCHARGSNAGLPPVWLIYITVENLDRSVARVEQLGGKVRQPIRSLGGMGRMCVIEDPAGAVAALFEPAA
jgi:predicted enzyme related to lactoylglutathione lyase